MVLGGRPLRRTVDPSLSELDEILSKSKLSPLLLPLTPLLDEAFFVFFLSTDFLLAEEEIDLSLAGLLPLFLIGVSSMPSSSASASSSSEIKRSSSAIVLSAPSWVFCMARNRRYDPRMTSPQSM
jgi:hypothetical protein